MRHMRHWYHLQTWLGRAGAGGSPIRRPVFAQLYIIILFAKYLRDLNTRTSITRVGDSPVDKRTTLLTERMHELCVNLGEIWRRIRAIECHIIRRCCCTQW